MYRILTISGLEPLAQSIGIFLRVIELSRDKEGNT